MSRTFTLHGNSSIHLAEENFGGYFEVWITCHTTVVVTVPDILGANNDWGGIRVTLSNMSHTVNQNPSQIGGGFWNVGGLTFPYIGNSYRHYIGQDPSVDNWETALNDMWTLCSGTGVTSVYYVGAGDDNPGNILYWANGSTPTWSRQLNSSDWTNGNLNPLRIFDIVARYYDGDPQDIADCHYIGSVYSDSLNINWEYIPWAIKRTNWMSHNRSGGNFAIMNNGNWRTIKNNLMHASQDHAWQRQNGSWVKSPMIGNQ